MRVVFVHINQVEVSAGNPRLFFVRVTLQSPATSTKVNPPPLQLTLRTDISTEPTLTPSFRLSKLHFKLPALAPNDKKKQQPQPSNDQLLIVTLDVYEISPDAGPRLVGSAKSNVAALVDSAPPLALMSAPGADQVGVIRATARAFSGPNTSHGGTGNDALELEDMYDVNAGIDVGEYGSVNGAQQSGGSRIDTSEAYAEPGQCGKRLALTIVSLRNAHAFKNSALSFAVMTGTAVKTKSAPVLVTGSGDVMHLGLSLNCVVDSTYSPTASTLTTLVLFEREKPKAKFHLTLPAPSSQSWPSHAQLATVLKCSSTSASGSSTEGLEVHVLLATLDLTVSSPALLIRPHVSAAAHSTIATLDIKSTTAPLPISRAGKCLLHVQALSGGGTSSVDAFLNDMISNHSVTPAAASPSSAVAPRHLAKFPVVTFDGSGTPTSAWPPAPPAVKSHAKYLVSDPGRSSIIDNAPVSFHRRAVLLSPADHRSAVNLAFQLFAVVSPGHEYVLVAYGTLEMDHTGRTGGFQQHPHRVRLFPTTAYRTVFATANCGRVYLDVGVHLHHPHGQDKSGSTGAKRGEAVSDEAVVDLPMLEPPSQHTLLDEFQDMAKAIMDLRLEKQRLARDCARLEVQLANGVGAGHESLPATGEQLGSMARDELIEYCLGVQSALRAAKATESIKRADAAKLHNQTETTQILQDQIRHLQDTVSKQQLQLQELPVFRKRSERLKALVHQQESVIQHLERLTSASSIHKSFGASNGPVASAVHDAASQPDIELMMRCSKAESRVMALEKQIQELSGRIAAAKVGSGNSVI